MNWFQELFPGSRGAQDITPLRPELHQLRAYWDSLRQGDDLPDRDDFDPRAIAGLLEHCLLLERIAPGQARIRLAGMQVNSLMGHDLRGMPLFTLITPAMRERFRPMVEAVFARPAIVTLRLQSERGLLRGTMGAQMALMPMRGRHGHIDRALAIMATQAEPFRLPRRFDLSDARMEPITLPGLTSIDDTSLPALRAVGDGTVSQRDTPVLASRGHLRLVHSR